MNNIEEIDQQRAALLQQVSDLETARIQVEQAERQALYDQLLALQREASDYRSQASSDTTDAEKQNLYRFAAGADRRANEIRLELGLELDPIELEPEPIDPADEARGRAYGAVNSLLIIAVTTGASYLLGGYAADKIGAGFLSFLLFTTAQLSYYAFLVSAVCWVSFQTVLWFIPDYFPVGLKDDFGAAEPRTRLYILAGFAVSILYLLALAIHAK